MQTPAFVRLTSRVTRILGQNPGPMTLDGTNTYLIGTGNQRILVDSGEGKAGYAEALADALADASAQLGEPVCIRHLLLTHGHPDHTGGVDQVRCLSPTVQVYKMPSETLPSPPGPAPAAPPPELEVPGAHLTVFPTPGHTDDHVCACLEEESAIFTGDTILGVGSSVFSCYTDFMASLAHLKARAPARLYPAHGPVVEDGTARIREVIEHRGQREAQILSTLATTAPETRGWSIEELVSTMYRDVDRRLWGAAGVNVFHHVKKLLHEGQVVVVQAPRTSSGLDVLEGDNDYRVFGEGMAVNVEMMEQVFRTFCIRRAT